MTGFVLSCLVAKMTSPIYYRLFGQAVVLTMHSVNSLVMFISVQDKELMSDPEIKTMVSMQGKYLTVWNIGFQLSYFFLAFLCDISTVLSKEHMIPKSIRKFRRFYLHTTIWPVATLIFVIFWPFFLINRELLFPAFIDKIFSFKSNLVMHFCIFPAALWELFLIPRPVQTSHVKNIGFLTLLFVFYNIVINYTYSQRGIWPYPILNIIYPTVYYPLLIMTLYMVVLWCYFMQWRVTNTVENSDRRKIKKNKI